MKYPEAEGLPLEIRLEHRRAILSKDILQVSEELTRDGISERGLAAFISCHDYLNEIVGSALIGGAATDREQFVIEFQSALRKLVHGLTTGEASKRQEEQLRIARSPGKLRAEVAEALSRANGSGIIGPEETVLDAEQKI